MFILKIEAGEYFIYKKNHNCLASYQCSRQKRLFKFMGSRENILYIKNHNLLANYQYDKLKLIFKFMGSFPIYGKSGEYFIYKKS